jgi:hypothetical protein
MENQRYNAMHKELRREHRQAQRDFVLAQKTGKVCALCGEDDVTKLVFHHLNPATKSFSLGSATRPTKTTLEEVAKCVIWCKICHDKYHHEKQKK